MFAHGFTFGAHPVAAAVALANLDIFEREDLCGHVREHEAEFRETLEGLRDLPIVGDVRGAGYFHAIELVKDRDTKESFDEEESERLLRGFLSGELYRRGLICRADDRGDPVVQLAPPLIAGEEQFEEIEAVLRVGAERGVRPHGRLRRRGRRGADSMLTVQGLLDELGLSLAAGRESAEAPIRWVHISELLDPTPWMSGGELLLTTGIQLTDPDEQRAFVRRLVDHHVAGLGFGVGLEHDDDPAGDGRGGRAARVPAVRGAVRDAVHRDHREGVRAAGQRAVRGAPARDRGPPPAGAARARATRAGRGRARRCRPRSAAPSCCSTPTAPPMASATFRREIPAAALEAIRAEATERNEAGPRGGLRAGPRRGRRAARSRCRSQPSRAGRVCGSLRSATPAAWASSSA